MTRLRKTGDSVPIDTLILDTRSSDELYRYNNVWFPKNRGRLQKRGSISFIGFSGISYA